MSLSEIQSRSSVLSAIAEYDEIGREAFLAKYGFGEARRYFIIHDGHRYDSKAIVGAAHGFEFPHLGPLERGDFSGGEATVQRKMEELGFEVEVLAIDGEDEDGGGTSGLHPISEGGELDATFSIEVSHGDISLIFEARGGARGSTSARNTEYAAGLEVVLDRLKAENAAIRDILVDSSAVRELPAEERRLVLRGNRVYPIALGAENDIHELRLAISDAQARVGRPDDAGGGGNPTRRLRLSLGFRASEPPSIRQLASRLVGHRERRYWALCANPGRYRIDDAVRERESDTWVTSGRDIQPGDRIVIWRTLGADGHRGVVALGEVLDSPKERSDADNPYWLSPPDADELEERVTVRYVTAPNLPLWLDGSEDPAVSSLSVARARGGTVFNVTSDQWDSLVSVAGGWAPLRQQLERESRKEETREPFDPSNVEDGRKRTLRQIAQRQGQGAFRRSLFDAYGGRCAITSCDVAETLEAAHIFPYRGEDTNHVTNGLLLRADLHTLFDLGLIAIDSSDFSIVVANQIRTTEYGELHGKTLGLPGNPASCPSKEALDWHRSESEI